MGFVRQKKIFRLVFADPEMEGLEVRIRSMSVGQALDLVGLIGASTPEREKTEQMLQLAASALVSWNVEEEADDGDPGTAPVRLPVPATLDGLRSLDIDFVVIIVKAWVDAVLGVSAPLGQPSPGGGPSLEASIPMDVPTSSPPSSTAPS